MRLQVVDVAHGVDGLAPTGRSAGSVTAAARRWRGWTLTSWPRRKTFTRRPVGPDLDPAADQVAGHRVERLVHLDVVVAVDLGRGVDGQVVGLVGAGRSTRCLLDREHLGRAALGGAVDAHPGPLPAPRLGPALGVGQVDERLAGEERLAHERHRALHPGLVLG